ncbi:ectoine/hydroxyectoine ABC transporter ATP-binding protein EhuA [Nitrosococcus wardiae]|uniref:Ectoine/hydroxyectoine ABC transporter ATP-binding protein EhuA n=1 Tax=Nitrosococcus wardiae TaxID=1814290 RepID=A0A4P7C4H3_9GAMM|nr:ectoine/hydroxyectoine ABC transporter ATP-binding protein EhuA [Nitrosococcus wardiae]QBQ56534.1 ectoine/hydroxyectoine ABC transporter ATP-binding protein EhuA [Nitrosococcus wardiae]
MREVRKSFDGLDVLKGIDLDIPPSQKLALIGPSGSGKSTILRILMTLEDIDSGRVEIDGESIWTMQRGGQEVPADRHHIRKVRGKVGMVFQHFNLFPHMSVLRNVTEAMVHVLHMPREEAEKGAVDLLRLVGLEDKVENYPAQLSGGQKQRVAIARALALRPQVMLFDEVTSALDPELVGEVLNVLRQIAIESEMTMLIVTHEMSFAQDISDRVIFMAEGKIIEDDTPDAIFSRPKQKRTQEFLRTIL